MKTALIALILLFSINILASDFNFGIKIGGTYSNADAYDVSRGERTNENSEYYWGTFFSFYGNKNVYKMIDLQLEVNLNQKGFQYEEENEIKMTLQLIESVALIKFNFNNIKPYFGFFCSLTMYKKKFENEGEHKGESEGDGRFSKDNGYILGIEYQYKQFLIDFRYNQSLGMIYDSRFYENMEYYDNARQFVLSFGYEF